MDLQEEINNHLDWIERVTSLISNEQLDDEGIQEITQHDQCALGQWLESEDASPLRQSPEFQKLMEDHAAFHQLAGGLIVNIQQGNEDQAMESLDHFLEISQQVVSHLQALQEETSKE